MTDILDQPRQEAQPAARSRLNWDWVGIAPFLFFVGLFLIAPVFYLLHGAFQTADGRYSLETLAGLFDPQIRASFGLSIRLSFASALVGTLFGLALAYALYMGRLPTWVRSAFMTWWTAFI